MGTANKFYMITLAICTWNRCELLSQTLEQIIRVNVPKDICWELLVIDNNCSDNTGEVLSRFKDILPLRIVIETTSGLSVARNRAIEEAKYDWLIFIDDDVLLDIDFIEQYVFAIQDRGREVAFFGGQIQPWFPVEPDPILAKAIPTVANGFCGVNLNCNRPIRDLSDGTPFGANMAVNRCNLGNIRFDPNLGVKKHSRLTGEEVDVFARLLKAGQTGYWLSGPRLKHYVDPKRLKLSYLTLHLYGLGRSSVIIDGIPEGRKIFGIPVRTIKNCLSFGFEIIYGWIKRDKLRFYKGINLFFIQVGMAHESWSRSNDRNNHNW